MRGTLDPMSILKPPFHRQFIPDSALQGKIVRYFSSALNKPAKELLKKLPATMMTCGKVMIACGGDLIRAKSAQNIQGRDGSFVRVRSHTFHDNCVYDSSTLVPCCSCSEITSWPGQT
jgi:hypothetical protein